MNNFNFLPDKFKKNLKNIILVHLLYVACVAVLIWGVIFGITIFTTLEVLNIQNNALEESIANISGLKETAEARTLETEISEFNQLLTRIQEIEKAYPHDALELIMHVANAVPEGVDLNSLSFSSGTNRIFISGHADLRTQVITLENKLREDELFENVDSPLSNLFRSEDIDFQFTITLSDE